MKLYHLIFPTISSVFFIALGYSMDGGKGAAKMVCWQCAAWFVVAVFYAMSEGLK